MKTASTDRTSLLALPALGLIAIFLLIPMGIALIYSWLTPSAFGGVTGPLTPDSYTRFLFERDLDDSLHFDSTYLIVFGRSALLAISTMAICLVIGVPVAWYMATRELVERNRLVLLITIPFWTNLLIRTYCWVLILRDQGLVNLGLQKLGITDSPISFLYSEGSILLGLVYSFLPFMILPVYAALEKLDLRLIEAGFDLYATRLDIFKTIVWPAAKPGVAAGALLVFAPALGAFLAPDLLGGGRKLMIGSLIQMQFTTSRDWPFGAACAMILMAVVLTALTISARRDSNARVVV
jgi:spermidine/putrescine transport system permease protein